MRDSVSLDSLMVTAGILVFCSLGVAVLAYALFLMPAAGADYLQPLTLGSKIGVPLVCILGLIAVWSDSLLFAPPFSRHLLYRTRGEEFDAWDAWYGENPRNCELLTPYLERKRRERRQALVEKIRNRSASWKDIAAPVARILVRNLRDSLFLLGAAYFFFFVYLVLTWQPEDFSFLNFPATEARSLALCVWATALIISALVSMEAHRAPALLYKFLRHNRAKKDNGNLPCFMVLFLSAALVTASGCAGRHGFGGSFVGDLPGGGAVEAIAADASGQIAELYPPGHTRLFVLTPEKDAHNDFSQAFESALRRSGFTVLSNPAENAVAVAYVLDRLDGKKDGENAWYLQLRISDNENSGLAFARSYTAAGTPEAGRSRTDTAFSRSAASRLADKVNTKARRAWDTSTNAFGQE